MAGDHGCARRRVPPPRPGAWAPYTDDAATDRYLNVLQSVITASSAARPERDRRIPERCGIAGIDARAATPRRSSWPGRRRWRERLLTVGRTTVASGSMPRAVSLSASDGSRSSISSVRQPMTSSDGRYVLVFNGEVYDHAALRHELEGRRCLPRPMRHRGAPRGHPDLGTATRSSGSTACSPLRAGTRVIVCFTSRDRFGRSRCTAGSEGPSSSARSSRRFRPTPDTRAELDRERRLRSSSGRRTCRHHGPSTTRSRSSCRVYGLCRSGPSRRHLGRGVPGRPSTRRWRVATGPALRFRGG